jgi:pimeloyl-ACP methyl ester carboxylesterase
VPYCLKRALSSAAVCFLVIGHCQGQENAPDEAGFPQEITEVRIESSIDQTLQPSLAYFPPPSETRGKNIPLLVGLHSWSGDYRQAANIPMAEWCVAHDWAFIHPNFRGPNWTPDACGSDKAVQDVLDAVSFMKEQGSIDLSRIYLMGTSGGGHMSLLVAGRHPTIWAGVSAWVPITDLSAWFYECRASGRRYAADLMKAIGSPPFTSIQSQRDYQHRSPLTWLNRAQSLAIDINAGIRDGHDGSVPISHSLMAFNRLVPQSDQIQEMDILELTGMGQIPEALSDSSLTDSLYGETPPLFRKVSGKIRVTIFDGGHEGILTAGLSWLAQQVKQQP